MQVTPVSDIAGAEVTDIDLSQPLDSNFGGLEIPDNKDYVTEESDRVMILSNEIRPDGSAVGVVDGGDFWHSDSSHHVVPSKITILQSVHNPAKGGDTEFCSMYAVYDALPEATKKKIDGLYGVHHVSKIVNKRVTVSPGRPGAKDFYEMQAKTRENVIQPLVLTHPDSGRKALYCSPRFTIGIKGMSEEEADPILDELFACITDKKRRFHYRHKWQKNDLVMWDNRCLCHRAVGGYGLPHIRRMHRTVVGGEAPYAEQAA
jgi:taurine dioxygenase